MKFSSLALSSVAALATANAALTPYDVSYDLMAISVRRDLLAITQAALDENNPKIFNALEPLESTVETLIATGQIQLNAYHSMRSRFKDEIAKSIDVNFSNTFASRVIGKSVQITGSSMFYAPDWTVDATFDAVDIIASTAKHNDVLEASKKERAFFEEKVRARANPAWLATRLAKFLHSLNRDYPKSVANLLAQQAPIANQKYGGVDLNAWF